MTLDRMREQWDAIATRNAFYGVVSWPAFQALDRVDREKFWATGRREVAFRTVRAVTHPRRAFRTALTRLRARLFPPRATEPCSTTLADEFDRYESWRGCALRAAEVEQFAASLGLHVERVTGVGTQYTFYTLRRAR